MHRPGGALATRLYIVKLTLPPEVTYRWTQLVHLSGGGPYYFPLTSSRPRCLQQLARGVQNCASPERGHLLRLPPSAYLRRRRFISYRYTQVMQLLVGPSTTPLYIGNAHVASGHLLPAHRISKSPGRGPCNASQHQQYPCRLLPSPTGEP